MNKKEKKELDKLVEQSKAMVDHIITMCAYIKLEMWKEAFESARGIEHFCDQVLTKLVELLPDGSL